MTGFDFDAAVAAPFRMQPGLRRLAAGARQLTPLAPGSRHQREKLAVLSAFPRRALQAAPGFDAAPALDAVAAHAAAEWPEAWAVDGDGRWHAKRLAVRVHADGTVQQHQPGRFGLGDEIARCLAPLPAPWRRPALLALAFAEDFAVLDGEASSGGAGGRIAWLAVCLPSHWAPEDKVGQPFADVHAPVADGTLVVRAADALTRLVTGPERWERFVWTITDEPRLHAHPATHTPADGARWSRTPVDSAWFRSERQTFVPVPGRAQAVFTIAVDTQPLARVLDTPGRARALHDAVASMSEAVLAYRGLQAVRGPLLAWLAARAAAAAS